MAELSTGETDRPGRERVYNLDVIRALAIVMVVVLHVAAVNIYRYNEVSHPVWWASNIIDTLCRACVPFFLMISGYLLLDPNRTESLRDFFRRRLVRVGIPMVAWLLIYLVWSATVRGEIYTLRTALKALIAGPVYFHLWFLYPLAGLYLVTPILRSYTRSASVANQRYFLLLWAVTVGGFAVIRKLSGVAVGIDVPVTAGYVGYFAAGPLLRQARLDSRRRRQLIAAFVIAALVAMAGTFALLVRRAGTLDEFFYSYTSLTVMVMAFSAFLVLNTLPFQHILEGHPRIRAVIDALSRRAFGIYLVHVIVLELLQYQKVVSTVGTTFLSAVVIILILSAVSVLLSMAVVAVFERIPLLHLIVGL